MTTIASMEPMLPDERQDLEDLATDLVSKASSLASRLHLFFGRRSATWSAR